jgi:hypothetical protein
MRPLPSVTVQAVVVFLLTAEVMHDVVCATGAIACTAWSEGAGDAAGSD